MTSVFIAVVPLQYDAVAVATTAEEAKRLACEKAFEYLKSVHGDLGYDDPALVEDYFGCNVYPFEVGGPAQLI
ncbi:hypothetical protein KIY76_gp76 [Mycobacterium phage Miramae]|uniref:Uncharacterized protein n=2 Tax=Viruses TaxID=10239 RepID=A0A482JHH8_9CAUD|nr:hypothetical protein KIY76_gp76 [Mycobacterium phage Miramae]QBP31461.1 hypothetical protein SEA_MIRAMAE_76 [Mycobacterium phage Miramae]QBP32457.1 hypothetical protein SEA_AVATARAHPEG_76 [Mycobacterium phage AvatarAhPeg]